MELEVPTLACNKLSEIQEWPELLLVWDDMEDLLDHLILLEDFKLLKKNNKAGIYTPLIRRKPSNLIQRIISQQIVKIKIFKFINKYLIFWMRIMMVF